MDGLCRWRGENWDELDRQSVVGKFRTTTVVAKRRTAIRKFRIVQREGRRVTLSRKTAKNEALPKGWRRVKIIDFSPLQRGFDLPTDQIKEGTYPVVYSNGINNYHSEHKSKAPGVVTGRSGTIGEVTYVIQDYWPHNTSLWVTDFKDNHPKFVFYALQNLRLDRFYAGSGVPTLNRNDVHKQSILVPPPSEQKAIASLLETWDTAIEKTEALIAAKEKRFKWLLKTFTKPAKDWKKSTMSDSFDLGRGRVISKKYIEENKGIYPVFSSQTSNSGELGKINTFDFEGDYITWTTDGANAGEVFFRIGKFNCTNVCGTAKPKDEKEICSCFIAYYLKGKTQKYVSYVGNPKLMNGVFGTIPIRYPSYIQQQGIAHILNTVQQEIVLLRKLSEQYQTQKHGLMQKLLTGKWRLQI